MEEKKTLKECLRSDRNPAWHVAVPAARGGGRPRGHGIHLRQGRGPVPGLAALTLCHSSLGSFCRVLDLS